MSDQSEINYEDGEVVWVKLGSCWWPGEVVGPDKLAADILRSFRKPPIAVVKFFQETTYEYVKNVNSIFKYNCSRKHEFIKKGLDMYRSKRGHMEKFPDDIVCAETATGGDVDILNRDEFQEEKKESYAGLFGDCVKKTPNTGKKGKQLSNKGSDTSKFSTPKKFNKGNSDYKAHILVQTSKETPTPAATDNQDNQTDSHAPAYNSDRDVTPVKHVPSTPSSSSSTSGIYSCPSCNFTTTRLNVMILHNKSHSVTFMPYTPTPQRKVIASTSSSKTSPKTTPKTSKPDQKTVKPRKEKSVSTPKKAPAKKRTAEAGKATAEAKKPKTDEEIKTSLLADWDDGDEESTGASSPIPASGSPEIPVGAASPAVPTPVESTAQVPQEGIAEDKKTNEKQGSSSDSKYEFCEDEDWPVEKDLVRRIPRVKSLSVRKDNSKSRSIDDDDVAKEVAELLNKTTVPELPSVPEPLPVEQNFPEPSIVKSPDKQQTKNENTSQDKSSDGTTTKTIFKTKTFFRSRHSRSQDAIGKYVAEQLNAAERMDMSECELNGSEMASSPEMRDSSPAEPVKVARLAPKIQLKKMIAEAEQKEKERLAELGTDVNVSTTLKQSDSDLVQKTFNLSKNDINKSSILSTEINQHNNVPSEPIMNESTASAVDALLSVSRENDRVTKVVSYGPPEDLFEDDTKNDSNCNSFVKCVQSTGLSNYKDPSHQNSNEKNTMPTHNTSNNCQITSEKLNNVQELIADPINSTCNVLKQTLSYESNTQNVLEHISQNYENVTKVPSQVTKIIEQVSDITAREPQITEHELQVSKQSTEISENKSVDVPEYKSKISKDNSPNLQIHDSQPLKMTSETLLEHAVSHVPSESDLQIAETLINLPATTIKGADLIDKTISSMFSTEVENKFKENNLVITQDLDEYFNSDTVVCQTSEVKQRFESEEEKSENFNAAQSLVQMSEAVDLNVNNTNDKTNHSNQNHAQNPVEEDSLVTNNSIENITKTTITGSIVKDNKIEDLNRKLSNSESSPKLLKILEEPKAPKIITNKPASKQFISITPGKEKILNFDVGNSPNKRPPKQKIIIRRTLPSKSFINSLVPAKNEQVILSCNKPADDGSGIQTYTIQTTPNTVPEANNTIIIQPPVQKPTIIPARTLPEANNTIVIQPPVQKPTIIPARTLPQANNTIVIQPPVQKPTIIPARTQQSKQAPLVIPIDQKHTSKSQHSQQATNDVFDINSMPMVLSDELLTPESIEKMPIVMSDGNIIQNPVVTSSSTVKPQPHNKHKIVLESEKIPITQVTSGKPDVRTPIKATSEASKTTTTPNILSKAKVRAGNKPLLIIDKTTGKQKIIMRKPEPVLSDVKTIVKPTIVAAKAKPTSNTGKAEKFIILPSSSARPGRTQKIIIDPQTGKAHVLVTKPTDSAQASAPENKPVSAKLVPSASDGSSPGGTVMIITNAQGTQSRIVLTPEHEKLLFPNKQTNSSSVVKTQRPVKTSQLIMQKSQVATSTVPTLTQVKHVFPKTQTKIVPKPKLSNAIITSKGQLIVGGNAAPTVSTVQTLTTPTEKVIAPKRIIQPEFKKTIKTIKKTTAEPLIFLQQKSGAVMQLTAAQFEHLQRTGQFVQRVPAPPQPVKENRVIIQKSVSIPANEPVIQNIQKQQRVRPAKPATTVPAKKPKKEFKLLPSPIPAPALAPLSYHTTVTSMGPPVANTVSITTTPTSPKLENFEELLPSTAIARQPIISQEHIPMTETVVQSESVHQFEPQIHIAPRPEEIIHQSISQDLMNEHQVVQEEMLQQEPALEQQIGDGTPALTDGQLVAVPGENLGGPMGTFFLCLEDKGTLTPIDNRPLILENNQLVPMPEPVQVLSAQPERRDILEAALANSDVFHEPPREDGPDFRELNANVSVHCGVSETSTTLHQPIMTPVEVPTNADSEPTVPANLEEGLAVIGVTPHTVPTSLELPITVTDPRIAPKTTDPLSSSAYAALIPSPSAEMTYVSAEETCGSISMPLLEDDSVGKSMPILTDDVPERGVSSVESGVGSPSSLEVASSAEEGVGNGWARRLLTPGSDTSSELSAEIPLQPALQISLNELTRNS